MANIKDAKRLAVAITTFDNLYQTTVEEQNVRNVGWPVLCKAFAEHEVLNSKDQAKVFVGARLKAGSKRGADAVEAYSMLTLDFDSGVSMDEIEKKLGDHAYIIYTSWSHGADCDRFRVLMPLSQLYPEDHYRTVGRYLEHVFPEADKCSFVFGHGFFAPSCPEEGKDIAEVRVGEGHTVDAEELLRKAWAWEATHRKEQRERAADLYSDILNKPEATAGDVRTLLEDIDPDCSYDKWYRVGMAINNILGHRGVNLFLEWSERGSKYPGEQEVRNKYRTFKLRSDGPNIGTLKHYALKEVLNK